MNFYAVKKLMEHFVGNYSRAFALLIAWTIGHRLLIKMMIIKAYFSLLEYAITKIDMNQQLQQQQQFDPCFENETRNHQRIRIMNEINTGGCI